MNQHANTTHWTLGEPVPPEAAGKVLYTVYFNVIHGGNSGFTVYGTSANPRTRAIFPTLKWGNQR
jgi:hypothetical protein